MGAVETRGVNSSFGTWGPARELAGVHSRDASLQQQLSRQRCEAGMELKHVGGGADALNLPHFLGELDGAMVAVQTRGANVYRKA